MEISLTNIGEKSTAKENKYNHHCVLSELRTPSECILVHESTLTQIWLELFILCVCMIWVKAFCLSFTLRTTLAALPCISLSCVLNSSGTHCYYPWQFNDVFYYHRSHTDSTFGWGHASHISYIFHSVPGMVLGKRKASHKYLRIPSKDNASHSWEGETRLNVVYFMGSV